MIFIYIDGQYTEVEAALMTSYISSINLQQNILSTRRQECAMVKFPADKNHITREIIDNISILVYTFIVIIIFD